MDPKPNHLCSMPAQAHQTMPIAKGLDLNYNTKTENSASLQKWRYGGQGGRGGGG